MGLAVSAVSVYAFLRIDAVQRNIELVNRFHVPALKQLNLISGKWSTYQHAFEGQVGFKHWGDSRYDKTDNTLALPRFVLKKIIDPNASELARVLDRNPSVESSEKNQIRQFVERVSALSEKDPLTLAEIASFVKMKHMNEAALSYTRAKQEHLSLTQEMASLSSQIENSISMLQLSSEDELRKSQTIVFVWLFGSLLFSLTVLLKFRRWFTPVLQWTKVAQEIAMKGISQDVAWPKITRAMPRELVVLTSEFTRMARTVMEREQLIGSQKEKLQDQNQKLLRLIDAEEKLAHAKKLMLAGNMSSQIAHEVRNPLNAMSLQLEMLEEDVGPEQAERVRAVLTQVERLERITENYLEVGKTRKQNFTIFNIHDLIEKNVAFLSQELQAASIVLDLSLDADRFMIKGDEDAISQVFFNLVRNAIEALQATEVQTRRIGIRTENRQGRLLLNVSDNGSGIDEKIRSRLFEPFATSKSSGHGLGLSVSKQICIEHGGELKLSDRNQHAELTGAEFQMTVPVETI